MSALEVLWLEPFGRAELLASLRQTRLAGDAAAAPYARARLTLVPRTDPATLAPAQRYLLRPGVAKVLQLRAALLRHGIDLFALDGGVRVRASDDPGAIVPVLPPIVEVSPEPGGTTTALIADGIHRVHAARTLGLPITVVRVEGVAPEHPYYAHPLDEGWSGVVELDALPDGFAKKAYRRPEDPWSLFRDFNGQFPGVQRPRPPRTTTAR